MAIEFCPLASDYGNWAEWASVFVGVIAAAATIGVAFLAYRTSKRATEIADEAANIARQQHQEAVDLRRENARIVGRLLLQEVSTLPTRVASIERAMVKAIKWDDPIAIKNATALDFVLYESDSSLLPGAEAVDDRIHTLENSLGADLATLIGASRTLNEMAKRIRSRLRAPDRSPIANQLWPPKYVGSMDDFVLLKEHLEFIRGLAPGFANDFRRFVGVEPEDYAEIDAAIVSGKM